MPWQKEFFHCWRGESNKFENQTVKTSISFLLALLSWAGAMRAAEPQTPLTVAVYDFADADGDAGSYGNKVTALVTANLTVETNLIMVERSDLKRALGEQAIGISGMVNSDQAAKIGQLTGAKVLVSGQVIKAGKSRLVIVANIVGTETGRLFAAKVDGATENLTDLTSELSRKIAQKIRDEASNFVSAPLSHEDYLERIVRSVKGTNRPLVSVEFHFPRGPRNPSSPANSEMGIILQKAGFTVVDGNSERKPDVEITGVVDGSTGPKRGGLFTFRAVIEAKVQERRTGKIIAVDREMADAVDVGRAIANRNAQARAADALAEKLLPCCWRNDFNPRKK